MKTEINFVPIGDRVVVDPIEEKNQTESGIYIPDTARDRPLKGRVVAAGEVPDDINVGDVILYGKYAGTEIIVDDKSYLIMRVNDIFGTTKLK